MKFLVGGSLKKRKGVTALLSAGAVYFTVFLLFRFYHEWLQINSGETLPVMAVAEQAHADFFYFGMIFIFTASAVRELVGIKYRKPFVLLLFFAGIVFPVIKIIHSYVDHMQIFYLGTVYTVFPFFVFLMLYLVYWLNHE